MAFNIALSPEAVEHLAALTARERRIMIDAIEAQLRHEPAVVTRQRKPLRPNPLASWELRVDRLRVYYRIEAGEVSDTVYVIAVGRKIRDQIGIGKVKVRL